MRCPTMTAGQYIDNWAQVTTNWDYIGSGIGNDIQFDSIADDAWKAGEAPPIVFE